MWNDNINYEIEGENGTRITCTSLAALEGLVERLKKDVETNNTYSENMMLPFEFIIGSLFPASFEAVKDAMTQQYIDGYNKGYEDGKNAT